jgi:hypothetical protein
MTDIEKKYTPDDDEDAKEFVRRIISEQSDRDALLIVEQLVEIAVSLLKDRPCELSATASPQRMIVTLRHSGRPIDERMILLMSDHTDHIDYTPVGNEWKLVIRRDVPPPFVTRRK